MAKTCDSFLADVDFNKVSELMVDTEKNTEYFNSISTETALKYTVDLDNLMTSLYKIVKNPENSNTSVLESYFLELTNMIYFMGEKLEQLGIRSDMAKSAENEVYSKAYLSNQVKDADKKNKTTVAENQAYANQVSQYESVVTSIYEHAYKIVKFKIDAAKDMSTAIKKIISHRIQEEQLSMTTNNFKTMPSGITEYDESDQLSLFD